jgi:hypothetical protein
MAAVCLDGTDWTSPSASGIFNFSTAGGQRTIQKKRKKTRPAGYDIISGYIAGTSFVEVLTRKIITLWWRSVL